MRDVWSRLAAGVLGGLLAAAAFGPLGALAAVQEVEPTEEAWYQNAKEPLTELPTGDPSCSLPTGCNVAGNVVRPSPYPDNTLHVSLVAGQDDTETYLQLLDGFSLELGQELVSGTLTLPVAPSDRGTARPEQADIVACVVTGFLVSAEGGSFNDRPERDCEVSAPVERSAEDPLVLTVDLAPFAESWAENGTYSLALVPTEAAKAARGTWHVAFDNTRRAAEVEDGKPITASLELSEPETTEAGAGDGGFGGGTDLGSSAGGGFSTGDSGFSGGGFDSGSFSGGGFGDSSGFSGGGFGTGTGTFDGGAGFSGGDFEQPQVAGEVPIEGTGEEAAGTEQPLAAPPAAGQPIAAATTPGTNPAIWLLPLLGLSLAGALGWSLTAQPELPAAREGAVSRLVRSRGSTAAPGAS